MTVESKANVSLKSVYRSQLKLFFYVSMEGIQTEHNGCFWCVNYNIFFQITDMTLESKVMVTYTHANKKKATPIRQLC